MRASRRFPGGMRRSLRLELRFSMRSFRKVVLWMSVGNLREYSRWNIRSVSLHRKLSIMGSLYNVCRYASIFEAFDEAALRCVRIKVVFKLPDLGQVLGFAAKETDGLDGSAEGAQGAALRMSRDPTLAMPVSAYLASRDSRTARGRFGI